MTNITPFQEVSMNSLEISQLLTQFNAENNCHEIVRHDSVKRAIERLANRDVIKFPPTVEIKTATKPGVAYLFQGEQGKRDTYIVVAQLSPEFTGVIVDRWQELEGLHKNMSPAEILLYNAQRLVAQEREQIRLAARQTELEQSQNEIKHQVKALIDGENYFTVVGLCNQKGLKVDSKKAAKIGKKAAKICRDNQWETGTANHPLYGNVNTYPAEAIEEALEDTKH